MSHRILLRAALVALSDLLFWAGVSGHSGRSPWTQAKKPRSAPSARSDLEPPSDATIEKVAEAHAHYSAGVIHEMNEEPEAALQEYYQAALGDPADEALTLEVARRFLQ